MDEIWKIVRVSAMMNAERGPGYVEKLLANKYKEYHGWTGEH